MSITTPVKPSLGGAPQSPAAPQPVPTGLWWTGPGNSAGGRISARPCLV